MKLIEKSSVHCCEKDVSHSIKKLLVDVFMKSLLFFRTCISSMIFSVVDFMDQKKTRSLLKKSRFFVRKIWKIFIKNKRNFLFQLKKFILQKNYNLASQTKDDRVYKYPHWFILNLARIFFFSIL